MVGVSSRRHRNSDEKNAVTHRRRSLAFALTFVVAAAIAACHHSPAVAVLQGQSPVHLTFVPANDSFAAATEEYRQLWASEGQRMIGAMERLSGLSFASPPYADTVITAVVFEGVSNSGFREQPMKLRASYPPDTKKATLLHELGHRLQIGIARPNDDEHAVLFLWLYDVWVALYGQQFADAQVLVERARRGPYPAAWDSALSLSAAERRTKWKALVAAQVVRP
jgi:hypothetical protein